MMYPLAIKQEPFGTTGLERFFRRKTIITDFEPPSVNSVFNMSMSVHSMIPYSLYLIAVDRDYEDL